MRNDTNTNKKENMTSIQTKRYYINGNIVREIDIEEEQRRQRLERERLYKEQQKRRKTAARRNLTNARLMTRGYVAFLVGSLLLVALSTGYFVQQQSILTRNMKQVSSLESKVALLKTENDELANRIETKVDLDQIKDIAIQQLGMKYAAKSQVEYYSVENRSYMNQYRDIPAN